MVLDQELFPELFETMYFVVKETLGMVGLVLILVIPNLTTLETIMMGLEAA